MNRLVSRMKLLLGLAFALGVSGIARAENWTLVDGSTFYNVHVISHDAQFVTIVHDEGGGKIAVGLLTPELKQELGYATAKVVVVPGGFSPITQNATPPREIRLSPLPTATAPAKPPVNVVANEAQIADDERKLDDIAVDIRDEQANLARDNSYYTNYNGHYDNTGTWHPNTVGSHPQARIDELKKQQAALEAEIAELKKEDASVANN